MAENTRIVRALMRRIVTLSDTEWLFVRAPADASEDDVRDVVEKSLDWEPFCDAVESISGFDKETSNCLKVEAVEECPDGEYSDIKIVLNDDGEWVIDE